jgi:serine/threonine protein kinase/WD40 repeat protein
MTERPSSDDSPAPPERSPQGSAYDAARPDATLSLPLMPTQNETATGDSFSFQKAYRIRHAVGRGGMGRIFAAADSVLDRQVAVKVCSASEPVSDALFLREAQVLAELAHPNIVPVHDFGRDAQGNPFYSMKLVDGHTLKEVLKKLKAGDTGALARYTEAHLLILFGKVCDAVAFAHSKGYLHRDIKPENVMVGEYGEVLLMDWGLAARMDERGVACGVVAGQSQIVEGTPHYMSPEQTEGAPLDVRSDVYGLGGLLYSILTRSLPVRGGSLEEILLKVRRGEVAQMHPEPEPPGGSGGSGSPPIPLGLRALIRKAMAVSKENRYQNVPALVSDLDAYLGGFATQAEGASLLRQLDLLVRRNPMVAALAGLMLLTAAVFTAGLVRSERQSLRHAQEAITNEQAAHKAAAVAQLALAELAESGGRASELQRALERVPEALRNQSWRYMEAKLDTADHTFTLKANQRPWKVCIPHTQHPNALLTLHESGRVTELDLATGAEKNLLSVPLGVLHNTLSMSPDGSRIVCVRHLRRPPPMELHSFQVELYSCASGQLVWSFQSGADVEPLPPNPPTFSPDGSLLLVSSMNGGGVRMLNAWTGELVWHAPEDRRAAASFVEQQSRVAIFSTTNGTSERDPWTGNILTSNPKVKLPSGDRTGTKVLHDAEGGVLTYIHAGSVQRSYALTGVVLNQIPLLGESPFTGDFAYLPSRNCLVILAPQSEQGALLQFWNAQTGRLITERLVLMDSRTTGLWRLAAIPDSEQIAVYCGTQMRIWSLPRIEPEWSHAADQDSFYDNFAFFRDEDSAAAICRVVDASGWHCEMSVLDVSRPSHAGTTRGVLSSGITKKNRLGVLSTNRDGTLLSAMMFDETTGQAVLKLFRPGEGLQPEKTIPLPGWRQGLAHLNPRGNRIWLGNAILDANSGQLIHTVDRTGLSSVPEKTRSPRWTDNSHVLEISMTAETAPKSSQTEQERAIVLWDVESGTRTATIRAPAARAISPSPDGSRFAEGGSDRRVRIRDGNTLEILREFRVHDGQVSAVAWHPHRPLLATASDDRTVRIWDLQTEKKVEEIAVFEKLPDRLYWDPQGKRLSVISRERLGEISIFRPQLCQTEDP